ncbi:MAG: exodeoxyribonuclease III [Enterocloster clostridioformis]
MSVSYGIGMEEHDTEGRVITAEFPEYYVVTCYTPNSQDGLARLDYRMKWEDDFLAYLKKLEKNKPVVFCGDLNVAHKKLTLRILRQTGKMPDSPMKRGESSPTFWQRALVDTFRLFLSGPGGIYSWWSYRFSARAKNAGWRIDYFCVSESLKDRLVSASIHNTVMGSDHCPVELVIE